MGQLPLEPDGVGIGPLPVAAAGHFDGGGGGGQPGGVGFLFLPEKLAFDLNRLDPLQGMRRIFSLAGVMRLSFGLVKLSMRGIPSVFTQAIPPDLQRPSDPLRVHDLVIVGEVELCELLRIDLLDRPAAGQGPKTEKLYRVDNRGSDDIAQRQPYRTIFPRQREWG